MILQCVRASGSRITFDRDLMIKLVNLPSMKGLRKDILIKEVNLISEILSLVVCQLQRALGVSDDAFRNVEHARAEVQTALSHFQTLVGKF